MHGSTDTALRGAPLSPSTRGRLLSETSVLAIDRHLKYLAYHLAPTADHQKDLISVGLRAIHYAQLTYESDRGASLETYLVRCAHRAMLDFLRAEVRQTGAWLSGDAPAGPNTEETVFDGLADEREDADPEHAFLLQQVKHAVQDLPQRQKECIHLRYYEGWGNGEIASILGISRPRVTQLIAAGVKQLRGRLAFRTLTQAAIIH